MVLGDLFERLIDAIGLSGADGEIVVALLALLLIVVGIAILLLVLFGKWARTVDAGESRLLPTLAEDVLDGDLRHVYEHTLVLDRLVAEHFPVLASDTGTPLGRRVRKFVVRVQASRFAGGRNTRGEPSQKEARLEEVDQLVQAAVEQLGAEVASSSSAERASQLLDELDDQVRL